VLAETNAAAAAYVGVRARTNAMLRTASPDDAATTVPACPEWTVKDLAAHMAGVCEDILAGNLEGVATDAWTGAQVTRHAGGSLDDVLDCWDRTGPDIEASVPNFPQAAAAQFVFDATNHEHDLRGALGQPGARDADALSVGLSFVFNALDGSARAGSVPPVEVITRHRRFAIGADEPALVLRADLFEVFRAFGGRRSFDQIRALDWTGDPTPLLAMFETSPLHPPTDDLVE
jgi:uncharacterized protein (TIGR03083 family)